MRRRRKKKIAKTAHIEDAFIAIRSRLARYIARMVANASDVEDILQDTYLKARNCAEKGEVKNPRGYLFAVARTVALNDLAKKSRSIIEYIDDASALKSEADEPSVEEQITSRQRYAIFCEAVATLPPQCRRAFILRKVYGFTQKEIAREMGVSESTIEKHLIKGLRRSREFILAAEQEEAERYSTDLQSKSKTETG